MFRAISLGILGDGSDKLSSCDVDGENRYTSAESWLAATSPARAAAAMPVNDLILCRSLRSNLVAFGRVDDERRRSVGRQIVGWSEGGTSSSSPGFPKVTEGTQAKLTRD